MPRQYFALGCQRAQITTQRYSTMPAKRRTLCQHDKRVNDPRYEERIQMGIEGVSAGRYHSYKAASIQLNVSTLIEYRYVQLILKDAGRLHI
jgi:hypothetical protein